MKRFETVISTLEKGMDKSKWLFRGYYRDRKAAYNAVVATLKAKKIEAVILYIKEVL